MTKSVKDSIMNGVFEHTMDIAEASELIKRKKALIKQLLKDYEEIDDEQMQFQLEKKKKTK